MIDRNRLWRIVGLGIAVVAIVALAEGLSGLELQPGRPLILAPTDSTAGDAPQPPAAESLISILPRLVSLLLIAILPLGIVQFIRSPQSRKRFVRSLPFYFALVFFNYLIAQALQRGGLLGGALQAANALNAPGSTGESETLAANPPDWLSYVAAIVVVLAMIGIGGSAWRRTRRAPIPRSQIAKEAQSALEAIRAGGSLRNAVIRCYVEMSRVLLDERGLRRPDGMTPREFERQLVSTGLPREEVLRLTRLFERARYSDADPSEREEREAVKCLTAIVDACAGST